jgi:peroxiredoxin
MSAEVGELAPDFELSNQHGETVKLSDFRDKKAVVLVFYPLSFSGICTGELCEIRDNISVFQDQKVELLGVSVDSKFVQKQFADHENYQFSLLSDFWPHGQVAQEYGVFLADKGIATRATFVISREGVVVAKFVTSPGEPRSFSDYKRALELV